jgi:hypothetical protein
VRSLVGFRSLKLLWRIKKARRSQFWGQIMGVSTPQNTQGNKDKEGADSTLQLTTEQGCRAKEYVHRLSCQGNDS